MDSRHVIGLAVAFLALCVVALAGNKAWEASKQLTVARDIALMNTMADRLITMTNDAALERGHTAAALGARTPPAAATLENIRNRRARVDASWQEALTHARQVGAALPASSRFQEALDQVTAARTALEQARQRADRSLQQKPGGIGGEDWIRISAQFIQSTARLRETAFASATASHDIAQHNLLVKHRAWVLSEYAGLERATFALQISNGQPLTRAQQGQLQSIRGVLLHVSGMMYNLRNLPDSDPRILDALATMEREYFHSFERIRTAVHAGGATGRYPQSAEQWLASSTAAIDSILAVVAASSEVIQEKAAATVQNSRQQMHLQILLALLAFFAAAVCLLLVRRTANALYHEKELAEVTLHSIGDAVITTDALGNVEHLNPIAETLTGWPVAEARGRPLTDVFNIINGVTREPQSNPIEECLRENRIVGLANNTVLIGRDGTERVVEDSAAPVRNSEGKIVGAVMVFYDVTLMRNSGHILSYHATHDSLTGLVNRREFERHLTQLVENAKLENKHHVLCYLDLDQFKVVNDTCGHIAGDRLLRQLAHLLRQRIREHDTLARLGGDEFGILLDSCQLEPAQQLANDLVRLVNDFRFVWGSTTFEVGVSIGMVCITPESPSPVEILSQADTACYAAKDSGRNRVRLYEPSDTELIQRQGEMHWVARTRKALAEERFILHCQKIQPLSDEAGPLHYCEVLVRMLDESGDIVPPMAFIPAAERYNLMPAIDRWVIHHALTELARRRNGEPESRITWFINLSGASLADEGMLDYIRAQIEASCVQPGEVCFEITETAAVANLELAVDFIKALGTFGCKFALDDFGSGMSSFAYLKNLPVDYLKIAGTFVQNIAGNKTDHAMVDAINHVGHVMGIMTIAEHVESPVILERLREIGIDFAQGFAIHRPAPMAGYQVGREPDLV